jgi:hypothetical protein
MIITFVGPAQSRFVQNDIAILERKHTLKIVDANVGRGGSALLNLLILEFRIIRALLGSKILFFGSQIIILSSQLSLPGF